MREINLEFVFSYGIVIGRLKICSIEQVQLQNLLATVAGTNRATHGHSIK